MISAQTIIHKTLTQLVSLSLNPGADVALVAQHQVIGPVVPPVSGRLQASMQCPCRFSPTPFCHTHNDAVKTTMQLDMPFKISRLPNEAASTAVDACKAFQDLKAAK